MSEPILTLQNASVSYGAVEAVHGVSLSVRPGEIFTVIGANGAGKTTLLNAIMGLLPLRGTATFQGRAINDLSIEQRVAAGMALVAESRELFGAMSVLDNLRLGAWTRRGHADGDDLEAVFARFPRLKERRDQRADTMSGGERQMLAIGRALMSRPKLLMLDEPSLGLAPRIVSDIFKVIDTLRLQGTAVLLIEQNARAALAAAQHAAVMELGNFTSQGPAAVIAADPGIISSYLGLH
ncbi:MAG: ABC transporter ATP-binding protein [Hyphomicrobiales bacterium]|nr:ABC transporter ATP-binding protein [Hyphomicrobiales bacterium]